MVCRSKPTPVAWTSATLSRCANSVAPVRTWSRAIASRTASLQLGRPSATVDREGETVMAGPSKVAGCSIPVGRVTSIGHTHGALVRARCGVAGHCRRAACSGCGSQGSPTGAVGVCWAWRVVERDAGVEQDVEGGATLLPVRRRHTAAMAWRLRLSGPGEASAGVRGQACSRCCRVVSWMFSSCSRVARCRRRGRRRVPACGRSGRRCAAAAGRWR